MQRVRAIVVGYLQAFWYGLLGSPPPQQAQAQAPGSGDANTGNARGMCMPCGPAGSMATEDLRGLPLAFRAKLVSGIISCLVILLDAFRDDAWTMAPPNQAVRPPGR